MGKLTELLNNARTRARELGLPYAGALTPKEAHEVWNLAPGAKLVDVRTRAELDGDVFPTLPNSAVFWGVPPPRSWPRGS